jgi:hypothetical protein
MTWIETVFIVIFSFLANLAVAWLIFARANRVVKIPGQRRITAISRINGSIHGSHSYNAGKREFGGNTKIMLYKRVIVEAMI